MTSQCDVTTLTRISTNPDRHYSRPKISTLDKWACARRELLNESEEEGGFLHTLPNFKTKSGAEIKRKSAIQNREPKSGIDGVKKIVQDEGKSSIFVK